MTTTLVALYDDVRTAQQVVDALINQGFKRNNISLIARDADEEYASYVDRDDTGTQAAEGAGLGAVIGGIGGLLVGLGALAIPGIGPVVAAGPIVAGLTGAGVGAVAGGVIGALVDMGLPEEEAHHYAEGLRRGGTLVAAQVEDSRVDEAIRIMERYHPVDVNDRSQYWRESGWNRFNDKDTHLSSEDIRRERARYGINTGSDRHVETRRETGQVDRTHRTEEDIDIPIVEEEVNIGKRQVERGVRVRTYMVERPVEEQVTLQETRVNVERRPADRPASQADLSQTRGGTFEVTETSEELVVDKQARVTEEVHISKDRQQRTETVRDTARHTEVEVERVGDRSSGTSSDFDRSFREHYNTTYANSGRSYDAYAPAYQYGQQLASDQRYAGRSWNDVESSFQRDWTERHQSRSGSAWQDIKDAVRHGWERGRTR
jgi:stress response protein YsnF